MAGGCCGGCETTAPNKDKTWRRVLWIVLVINAGMFGAEMVAGVAAHSASLKADALDFLGDAANYAISLGVAGMALQWRARAAWLKGASLLLLGLWILASTAWMALAGTLPRAETMGIIGVLAFIANHAVAAPRRRRQPQVGMDLLAQRCDRQCGRGRRRARRVRHRHRLARYRRCRDPGRARRQWRLADRPASAVRIAGTSGKKGTRRHLRRSICPCAVWRAFCSAGAETSAPVA